MWYLLSGPTEAATLKLTAFLPPLYASESREMDMVLTDTHGVNYSVSAGIYHSIWSGTFRVDGLRHVDGPWTYLVTYRANTSVSVYTYTGIVQLPVDEPKVLNAGCFGTGVSRDRAAMVSAMKSLDPDIFFWSGDQTYEHSNLQIGLLEFAYQMA